MKSVVAERPCGPPARRDGHGSSQAGGRGLRNGQGRSHAWIRGLRARGRRTTFGRSPLRLAPILVPLAILLAACGAPDHGASISQAELAERLRRGDAPLLLDVRTAREFRSGHVPGAVHVPHDELRDRLPELAALTAERGGEVVVYCERGGRAAVAEEILRRAGHTEVRHLEGDMRAWREAGLPCTGC